MGSVHAREGDTPTRRPLRRRQPLDGRADPVVVDPDTIDIFDLPTVPGSCPTPSGFRALSETLTLPAAGVFYTGCGYR